MSNIFVIGTRDSSLALWQTQWVAEQLSMRSPGAEFPINAVKTKGDKLLDVALAKIGDKGLFTKELEIALVDGEADLAVHSMKDVPTSLPPGLMIGCICTREDHRDVLISSKHRSFDQLPKGARIGTSSLRRKAQLWHLRPDLELIDVRGNLQTRMRKLDEMDLDGIILAAAGVLRLGWAERITEFLSEDVSLPAVGQGSIGIECRSNDQRVLNMIQLLNDPQAEKCIRIERSLLRQLEGGCQIPIGCWARFEQGAILVDGMVASLDGKIILREQIRRPLEADSELVGRELAEKLLVRGAGEILHTIRQETR